MLEELTRGAFDQTKRLGCRLKNVLSLFNIEDSNRAFFKCKRSPFCVNWDNLAAFFNLHEVSPERCLLRFNCLAVFGFYAVACDDKTRRSEDSLHFQFFFFSKLDGLNR